MAAKIYLVARPQFDWDRFTQFRLDEELAPLKQDDHRTTTEAETNCEVAGRLCYMSFGSHQGRTSNKEYITNLIQQDHTSVLEHSVWSFILTNISRSLSHELVRHRAGWSFSQLSQRYVDEGAVTFIMPAAIAELPTAHQEAWAYHMEDARQTYIQLVDHLTQSQPAVSTRDKRIAARQAARSVLPNACATKVFCTVNGRALRHFFLLRGSLHAEPEIRALAHQWLTLMRMEASHVFRDLILVDGQVVKS